MRNFKRTLLICLAGTLGLVLITGAEKRPAARTTTRPAVGSAAVLANPESVGFAPDRLKRLEDHIEEYVTKKQLAGAVTMLARHGKVVEFKSYGVTDIAKGTPTAKDSLFRIY